MATARMRHHNSPEELAKRSGEPEPVRRGKEFRHYNHPDEVAKREAAGQPGGVAVAPRRTVQTTGTPMVWPPPGTVDNTASVEVKTAPAAPATPAQKATTEPPPGKRGDVETRLRRIENLLWSFVENVAEASEFRRLLNNQAAVTEVQQDINNRVKALEDTLDAALAQLNDDGTGDDDDDDEPSDDEPSAELPPLELDAPPALEPGAPPAPPAPPTVPDNPNPNEAT